ncbi:hypothetical protein LXA43DRAFT_87865 [Ganoderma leucocontextum]|nr:hypothetical protein LXA43DRAFT_87865 [Ganoderma leucocontextum]
MSCTGRSRGPVASRRVYGLGERNPELALRMSRPDGRVRPCLLTLLLLAQLPACYASPIYLYLYLTIRRTFCCVALYVFTFTSCCARVRARARAEVAPLCITFIVTHRGCPLPAHDPMVSEACDVLYVCTPTLYASSLWIDNNELDEAAGSVGTRAARGGLWPMSARALAAWNSCT